MTVPALIIKRKLHASINAVYAAWTDPSLMAKWFAPGTRQATDILCDPVEGGRFRVVMLGDDGNKSTTTGVYKQVIPNRKLVHTWQWADSDVESQVTIELKSLADELTELTLTHELLSDLESQQQHNTGWTGCLEKLDSLFAVAQSA